MSETLYSTHMESPPPVPTRSAKPTPAWQIVVGILLPFVWAGIAFGAGMMAMLMMAFGSDSGLSKPELQNAMLVGEMISIGVAGIAGIPIGLGIAWRKVRKVSLWIGGTLTALGILGAIVCIVVYFVSFM